MRRIWTAINIVVAPCYCPTLFPLVVWFFYFD